MRTEGRLRCVAADHQVQPILQLVLALLICPLARGSRGTHGLARKLDSTERAGTRLDQGLAELAELPRRDTNARVSTTAGRPRWAWREQLIVSRAARTSLKRFSIRHCFGPAVQWMLYAVYCAATETAPRDQPRCRAPKPTPASACPPPPLLPLPPPVPSPSPSASRAPRPFFPHSLMQCDFELEEGWTAAM
jgi:hypothetical protein